MLRIPRVIEYIFVCFGLWFFLGNPINLITGGGAGQLVDVSEANSNFLLPAISMMLYMIAIIGLLLRWKLILNRLKSSPQSLLLIAFLILIFISPEWSARPNLSSRRSILFIGATAFSTFFSLSFNFKQQIRFLAIALGINAVVCFLFAVLIPKYGVMHLPPHTGAWRGVYTHKNKLGAQMALTTIFLLTTQYIHVFRGKWNQLIKFALILAAFMVIASKSTTALLASVTMALTFFICNALKLNYRYMVIAISTIILVAGSTSIYIQANADALLSVFGKGTDLSGRDELWPAVWHMISQRPLLGYGYEGFWGPAGGPADLLRQLVGWPAPNAHNGFLEILLSVGWIGAIIFFTGFFLTTIKSVHLVRLTKQSYAICPVIVLVFLTLSNMTESNLFIRDSWILYVWASLSSIQILSTWSNQKAETTYERIYELEPEVSGRLP
ncbi:MAG: O-antigen ligase family protein [Leptolyngbyaceae cyanobacterium MAG.088]|nr:O-antigen ligase family protein [Leptolyngbyaceae cyanobacterium MAG.088]